MTEKASLFQVHRAVELNKSSPDICMHKHIGRGVRNIDSVIWDRERQNAVFASLFAKFTQNPAMKQQLLIAGTKRLAEASPLDTVWEIGLRADGPEPSDPRRCLGKQISEKLLLPSATPFARGRQGWHAPPPLINSTLLHRPTKFMRFLQRRRLAFWFRTTLTLALLGSFRLIFLRHQLTIAPRFRLSPLVSTPPSHSRNTAPRQGGHYARRRSVYHQNGVYSGADAITPIGCVALFETDLPTSLHQAGRLGSDAFAGCRFYCVWRICPSVNIDVRPTERSFLSS